MGAVSDLVDRIAKRFTDSGEKAVENPTGPDQEAAEFADRQLHEGAPEARDAAATEAGKAASKGFLRPGKIYRFERWLINQTHKAFDAAERLWRWLKKTLTPAKVAIGAGAVGGLMAISAAIDYGLPANNAPTPPPQPRPMIVDIDIPPPLPPEIWDPPAELATVEEDFRLVASQFDGTSLLDRLRIERLDLDTSSLPEPIVFAAAARAAVSVTENNATQTVETTVGQLYQEWPEAQAQLEEAVTQNRGADIHVDITVGSEVASISIRG